MATAVRLTIEEFLNEPREGRWELIDGVPVEKSLSTALSSWIAGELLGNVWTYLEDHPIGRVFAASAGFVLFPGVSPCAFQMAHSFGWIVCQR